MSRKLFITGASSEIGLAICKRIIKDNDLAILQCYKNESKLKALEKETKAKIQIYPIDLSRSSLETEFLNQIKDSDIVINAAAVTITEPLPNLTDDEIFKMIYTNNFALVKICQAVLPGMLVKRNGVIINISSVVATRGNRGQSVYAGTKGFIESFTRSIAAEYGARNIRANCVAPGPIEAGSLKSILSYAPDEVKSSIALNRLGKPDDVASLVSFLCSDEAGFINGKTIGVDGGFMRGV